jgi:hypothetical protein
MNKLLKEAIADAKAVRETALANAKLALEEAFTPRLQSMLSAKLSEEEEMDMEEDEDMTMDAPVEEPAMDEMEDEMEEGMREDDEDPMDMHSEEMDDEMEEEMEPAAEPEMEEAEGEDDLELEAIIRELEDELEEQSDSTDIGKGDNKMDVATSSDEEDPAKGKMTEEEEAEEMTEEDEDEVSIDEIIKALKEEDGEEEVTETEEEEVNETAEEDLEEAYTVIKFLKSKINEVNLLNAKLLFSNKLFRNFAMNESQKMKVIENFDRASTIREVKLVFSTLAESLKVNKTKRIVKESTASKTSKSTAPKRILSEGNQLASRWAKLAGLNKK